MTALESAVKLAWERWGDAYAMWTICSGCSEMRYCRRGRRPPWLCVECFDQR